MKSKLIVVTGGARSGKSLFAEEYLTSCSGRKAYVATAQILDEEMKERVAEHRRRRPEDWQTLEISSGPSAAFPAVLLLKPVQILYDHARHGIIIVEDILIARDILQCFLMLFYQRLDLQPDQTVQAHLQDGGRLALGKPQQGCHLL